MEESNKETRFWFTFTSYQTKTIKMFAKLMKLFFYWKKVVQPNCK